MFFTDWAGAKNPNKKNNFANPVGETFSTFLK